MVNKGAFAPLKGSTVFSLGGILFPSSMGQMFALVTFPCGGMTLEPADSPSLHKGRSLHGEYSRSCSFHTKESLLGIFTVAPVVLPGVCKATSWASEGAQD